MSKPVRCGRNFPRFFDRDYDIQKYPAIFCKENNGYSVLFPDLNWLATCGDTLEEAMAMAVDCLAGYLYQCRKDREPVPSPSKMADLHPEEYLAELSEDSVSEYFVNMVSVDVESYAKEHFEKSIKKTLSIPAWMNKAALERGINFSQVLQEALLEKLNQPAMRN